MLQSLTPPYEHLSRKGLFAIYRYLKWQQLQSVTIYESRGNCKLFLAGSRSTVTGARMKRNGIFAIIYFEKDSWTAYYQSRRSPAEAGNCTEQHFKLWISQSSHIEIKLKHQLIAFPISWIIDCIWGEQISETVDRLCYQFSLFGVGEEASWAESHNTLNYFLHFTVWMPLVSCHKSKWNICSINCIVLSVSS